MDIVINEMIFYKVAFIILVYHNLWDFVHYTMHHMFQLSEYTCPSCSDTFNSAEEQLTHLKLNSSHLRFEGERSYYKCNGCPKAFKSVSAHSKHDVSQSFSLQSEVLAE